MPFIDNRRIRFIAGVVALLFLTAPLSARGVDASTPVPEKIEVAATVAEEIRAFVHDFYYSTERETVKEYTEKADYILEFVRENIDSVVDPVGFAELVAPVAVTLELYSPDLGAQYTSALKEALSPLGLNEERLDCIMTAAKVKKYRQYMHELERFEGSPNIRTPAEEIAKYAKDSEYGAFTALELAIDLGSKDREGAALLFDAALTFFSHNADAYSNWIKLVECQKNETRRRQLQKESADERLGVGDLRKQISSATASSGSDLSLVMCLNRIFELQQLRMKVEYAESTTKTISQAESLELQKEIAPFMLEEIVEVISEPGGVTNWFNYFLETSFFAMGDLKDGARILDAYKSIVTSCANPDVMVFARDRAIRALRLLMREAKDEDAKLQVLQTLRDFVATDNRFIFYILSFFEEIDDSDVDLVLPLFNEYLSSLQSSDELVANYLTANGVKWPTENTTSATRSLRRSARVKQLRDEFETLKCILLIKQAKHEGNAQKMKAYAEEFKNLPRTNAGYYRMLPKFKELIESLNSEATSVF